MAISYEQLQVLQMVVLIVVGVAGWSVLRRHGLALVQAPFFIVVLGYGAACTVSNLLRHATDDFTVLSKISSEEYTNATFWWCASIIVFNVIYIIAVCSGRQQRGRGTESRMSERGILRKTRLWYICCATVLVAGLYLNPFRGRDYGVLNATDVYDLSTGGLLVSGILLFLLSAVTIPLLICRSILGLGFLLISLWLLLGTGSKAIGVVYFVVTCLELFRAGGKFWTKCGRWRLSVTNIFLMGTAAIAVAAICAALLAKSVSKRYGGEHVAVTAAASAAVGRFTQQELACLIHAEDDWREKFARTYIVDTVLSFVPGFVWHGKPKNPAYEINSLMGRGFTAASPSLFGAIFLACDGHAYWPLLVIVAVLLGGIDRLLSGRREVDFTDHIFWYLLYTNAMLFEGNFVIWLIQLFILVLWVAWLRRCVAFANQARLVHAEAMRPD